MRTQSGNIFFRVGRIGRDGRWTPAGPNVTGMAKTAWKKMYHPDPTRPEWSMKITLRQI